MPPSKNCIYISKHFQDGWELFAWTQSLPGAWDDVLLRVTNSNRSCHYPPYWICLCLQHSLGLDWDALYLQTSWASWTHSEVSTLQTGSLDPALAEADVLLEQNGDRKWPDEDGWSREASQGKEGLLSTTLQSPQACNQPCVLPSHPGQNLLNPFICLSLAVPMSWLLWTALRWR